MATAVFALFAYHLNLVFSQLLLALRAPRSVYQSGNAWELHVPAQSDWPAFLGRLFINPYAVQHGLPQPFGWTIAPLVAGGAGWIALLVAFFMGLSVLFLANSMTGRIQVRWNHVVRVACASVAGIALLLVCFTWIQAGALLIGGTGGRSWNGLHPWAAPLQPIAAGESLFGVFVVFGPIAYMFVFWWDSFVKYFDRPKGAFTTTTLLTIVSLLSTMVLFAVLESG